MRASLDVKILALYGAISLVVCLIYISASVSVSGGDVVMPLDDTYIHFQYARQLADGQPYIYNPGESPTSGATSFLYPYLLAAGYLLGFKGLSLGLWAVGIGAVSLTISSWLVYRLARMASMPLWMATAWGGAFALSGLISWHFMSGMETSIIVTFTLATFYSFSAERQRLLIASATLLALSRPEGSIMAGLAVGIAGLRLIAYPRNNARNSPPSLRRALLLFAVPILAITVQPILNLALTGSISAMGAQAKSILGTIPFHWDDTVRRILDNFARIWREFATGTNGYYVPVFIAPLALVGILAGHTKTQRFYAGLLIVGWFVVVSAALATLDTAFWHFKRYQMPLIALLYPLSAWGAMAIAHHAEGRVKSWWSQKHLHRAAAVCVMFALFTATHPTSLEFYRLYKVNIRNMATQPLPMARWINENTLEGAVIAVHDVGLIRYLGERRTIDMVGLTTRGAADAWRNGPGAVAEFLMAHPPPPDYIAAYTTARGLNYLVETGLYGELLASFHADYAPADNVALAADFQGIYRVTWKNTPDDTRHIALPQAFSAGNHMLLHRINVGNLDSEARYAYTWHSDRLSHGFATEVYELTHVGCTEESLCRRLDGGRRIDNEERFEIRVDSRQPLLLVTRLHPGQHGKFTVYVNDRRVATRWIPEIPGQWLEVATYIPPEYVSPHMTFRIVPEMPDGHAYMPYTHWVYVIEPPVPEPAKQEIADFQNGAIRLIRADRTVTGDTLSVVLDWQTDGSAEGDYKLFVHLYDALDTPPVAQQDGYAGGGTLPPGNWLPGTYTDTLMLDITGLLPGVYTIAVGFYDPYTFERLVPTVVDGHTWTDENSRRLFIGEVEKINNE